MRNCVIGKMRNTIFFLVLSQSILTYAQQQEIKNLVFEGAGMRGLAYAGVIEELESNEVIDQIERVGGTSAGAITAMMISLGYSSVEIRKILAETEFQKFNDGGIKGVSRMKKNFGWFHGDKFTKWVESHLEAKTGNPDITLLQIYEQGFLPIYAVATCVNKQELYVLSHETYPNMKVKDAIRASVSIPLYFQAVFVDQDGNTYENYEDADNLDILVDGGIIGNYPIFLFDETKTTDRREILRTANPNTLGFRIDSEQQIKQDSISRKITPQEINGFKGYVAALYNFTMESLNRNQMTDEDWARTVSVSSQGISPMIKKFSEEDQETLINSGRISTRKFLEDRNLVTN
ncbi:MAG: patatin-like phospholipase family protein [Cyclobacteriaceae bacterium]